MMLNRWDRWLLLVEFIGLLATEGIAQRGLKSPSDLDRLPVWHPVAQIGTPAFQRNLTEPLNEYERFGELVQKEKSGHKVESLVIDTNPLNKGGIVNLRQLQDVRVVAINLSGPRITQTDSLFQLIQEWPLLERVSININFLLPNATSPDQLVTLPASLSHLPKLHDVRLSGNAVRWRESFNALRGLKNLRHLEISSWQSAASQALSLNSLPLLKELKISGQSWAFEPETFAGVGQLTELSLSNVKVDAGRLQRSMSGLNNLQTLTIEGVRSLTKLSLSGLTHLKTVELQSNPDLVIDATTFAGLSALEQLIIHSQQTTDITGVCSLSKLKKLVISGSGRGQVTTIPDCIGQLTQLSELRLENLMLSRLPAQIGSLRGLKKLSVLICGLDSLPASFAQLSALQELLLSRNKFRQLPKLGHMRQLEQLDASNNQLATLPEDIGQLTQVKSIDISTNKLTQLPASFTHLANLRMLSLMGNQLERLPDDLGNLRKLQTLRIGNNQLTSLPDNLGQLDSLQNLAIGKNRLRTLPNSLTQLKNLKSLMIGENELTALPSNIGALSQLTELRLELIPITELPASVCELRNLLSLRIYFTRLRLLPENIGALTKLRAVFLPGNELITLPNSIGGWEEVTLLSLSGNKLEGLPNSIGRLDKLKTLQISGNEDVAGNMYQLPDNIVRCTQLWDLEIQYQPKLDVNDVLAKTARMEKLTHLVLSNNNFSQLPAIDWKLVPWETLDLSHNLLTELPVSMLDAPVLESIDIRENRLPEPLNRRFSNKAALRVAFAEAGVIPQERLSKPNRRVSEAYQQMANRKAGQRDWDGTFREMQKAIDFAPDTIVSILYWHRATFHSSRKQYSEALSDLNRAIQFAPDLRKDKLLDPALPSQMLVELWQQKATIFGMTGQYDTALSAIAKAESYLPILGDARSMAGMLHTERGRFLTLKNKPADADSSYRRAIRAYEKLAYSDPAIRLTIVELNLITGQYDQAKQALTNLPGEQIQYGYAILREYLDTCLAVLKGEQDGVQATERLAAYMRKQPARIYGWSFDLFDNWLAKAKLSPEKVSALHQLTNATKERLVKPE